MSLPTSNLPTGTGAKFAFSLWTYIPSLDNQLHSIITYGDGSTNGGSPSIYINTSNQFYISTWGGSNDSSGVAVTPNRWTHLVGVGDGTRLYLYVNGVLAVGPFTPAQYSPLSTRARIGAGPQASLQNYFGGKIDDVRIYKRELTATEIKALYLTGAATIR